MLKISDVLYDLLKDYRIYFWSETGCEDYRDIYHDKPALKELDLKNIEKKISDVNFKKTDMITDWKNYVLPRYIKEWVSIPLEDRALIFLIAVKEADTEYWD